MTLTARNTFNVQRLFCEEEEETWHMFRCVNLCGFLQNLDNAVCVGGGDVLQRCGGGDRTLHFEETPVFFSPGSKAVANIPRTGRAAGLRPSYILQYHIITTAYSHIVKMDNCTLQ